MKNAASIPITSQGKNKEKWRRPSADIFEIYNSYKCIVSLLSLKFFLPLRKMIWYLYSSIYKQTQTQYTIDERIEEKKLKIHKTKGRQRWGRGVLVQGGVTPVLSKISSWERADKGKDHFSLVSADKRQRIDLQLQQGKFRLYSRKRFFSEGIVKHWLQLYG